MKKFSLLICTVICAICAFGQESNVILPDSVWFTPYEEDGLVLNSVNDVITVHMDKVPNVPVTFMFVTGNGFGIDMQYIRDTITSTSYNLKLERKYWGVPYNEEFFLNLAVTFTYGEGDDIEYYLNKDGEPIVFQAMYMTHDNGSAEFVRSYPTGEWEKYYTFKNAYEDGTGTLYFTKEVQLPQNSIGTIHYFVDDEEIDSVSISNFEASWSEWDGLYAVNFVWSSEDYTADDLSEVVIDFDNITYDGQSISIPAMKLENINLSNNRSNKKSSNTADINAIITSEDGVFDIYNIQGSVVKKNANNADIKQLPRGLYVVNGKKMIVR